MRRLLPDDGTYALHATATHLVLGIFPESLGELDTAPFQVVGPFDAGTLTLHWQPEY